MSIQISISYPDRSAVVHTNVIGHALVYVVKHADDSITLEREFSVNADSYADNELVENVIKDIEFKIGEIFPDPNKPEPSKLWVP